MKVDGCYLVTIKKYTDVETWWKKIAYFKSFFLSLIYNIDLPRTKKEARIFQRMGIIPTHVIQLKVSNEYGKIIKKHI